jgi:hypothetical protein
MTGGASGRKYERQVPHVRPLRGTNMGHPNSKSRSNTEDERTYTHPLGWRRYAGKTHSQEWLCHEV